MSDATPPFAFSQFVPGFDFLKNLADAAAASASPAGTAGAATAAMPGMPGLSSWVAPTISVEEVDKRIQELKTVQYWLEQNGHALKATIQALEVQKMTLSTLRGMNVRMEDLASAFTRHATAPAAPAPAPSPASSPAPSFFAFPSAPAPAPAPQAQDAPEAATDDDGEKAETEAGAPAGVVDPMQWWNALTSQFQEIATSAMHDAAQIKMPTMPSAPEAPAARARPSAPRKKTAAPARGKAASAKAAPARKRTRGT